MNMSIQREELGNIRWGNVVTGEKLAPVHPGDILMHDFIEPMGLTRYKVAKSINVPQRRIDEICASKRAVTADTAMRLARLFGMDAQTWMNLQAQYDLEVAEIELGDKIDHEVMPIAA
jgi:addiction module HigA family antidote